MPPIRDKKMHFSFKNVFKFIFKKKFNVNQKVDMKIIKTLKRNWILNLDRKQIYSKEIEFNIK